MSEETLTKIEKTSRGLATAMFEELELLRSGESTPQQARSKASIANTICTISRLEMDFARFVTDSRGEDQRMKALPMA
ncbi:MAG: hypothetical protein DRQ62_13915 [Gammaproteobacteria bacterium]|nr:MAG: hypothetical protein DRQ62_13915 [Gammaproteobacteria bacterium]